MIEVANYQAKILKINLKDNYILKGQEFHSVINGVSYQFWVEDKNNRHFTIEEFNKNIPVDKLKENNLASKMLKLIIFFQNN